MILCVTGPMAAGKNAAADLLVQKGCAAIDADIAAHTAITACTPQIIAAFSSAAAEKHITLTKPDGTLDRRALGSLVFSDPVLLRQQEAIVYPKTAQIIRQFLDEHKDTVRIINATVLYKIPELLALCDTVLYIDAPAPVRLLRALHRDHLKPSLILARFRSQKKLFAKYRALHADIKRVWNTGSLSALEQKIDLFLTNLPESEDILWNRKR